MAMTECKECKKEVSTSAKKCPHCGVSHPAVTGKQQFFGLVILAIIVAVGFSMCSSGDSEPEAPKVDDATCKKDLKCWGDRHNISAAIVCAGPVEKLAKFSARWTDGLLEPKFSHFRWRDQQQGTVTYIGDKIEFQNGFGAFQKHVYECHYDPATNQALGVSARPGQL